MTRIGASRLALLLVIDRSKNATRLRGSLDNCCDISFARFGGRISDLVEFHDTLSLNRCRAPIIERNRNGAGVYKLLRTCRLHWLGHGLHSKRGIHAVTKDVIKNSGLANDTGNKVARM